MRINARTKQRDHFGTVARDGTHDISHHWSGRDVDGLRSRRARRRGAIAGLRAGAVTTADEHAHRGDHTHDSRGVATNDGRERVSVRQHNRPSGVNGC